MPPRRLNSDIIIVVHVAIIIIAIKYSTWTLAKLQHIDSGLKVVDDDGLIVHLRRHLVDGLNRRERPYTGRLGALEAVTSNYGLYAVLHVVDRGGLISKLVVVVIMSEVEALDLGVQVLVGDRGVLDFAQTFAQVVHAASELLELLIHTVRLVRYEELRFVEVLDHLLHDLVIICFISNVVIVNSGIVTPCPSAAGGEVARPPCRRGWPP